MAESNRFKGKKLDRDENKGIKKGAKAAKVATGFFATVCFAAPVVISTVKKVTKK